MSKNIMSTKPLHKDTEDMTSYMVGNIDKRSWGSYEVTDVGYKDEEEFCYKVITILPRQAISLQRHYYRSEVWSVLEGCLTVVVNGELLSIPAGEEIEIPKGAVHCMINLSRQPVLVNERQIGVCREDDNERLSDFSGRPTVVIDTDDTVAMESIKIYEEITRLL